MNERELAGFCRQVCYKINRVVKEVRDNSIENFGNSNSTYLLYLITEVAEGMEEEFSEWEKDLYEIEKQKM